MRHWGSYLFWRLLPIQVRNLASESLLGLETAALHLPHQFPKKINESDGSRRML